MGRPIYPYEMVDPDFSWLISNFQENHPHYISVEDGCLPVVFIGSRDPAADEQFIKDDIPQAPSQHSADADSDCVEGKIVE